MRSTLVCAGRTVGAQLASGLGLLSGGLPSAAVRRSRDSVRPPKTPKTARGLGGGARSNAPSGRQGPDLSRDCRETPGQGKPIDVSSRYRAVCSNSTQVHIKWRGWMYRSTLARRSHPQWRRVDFATACTRSPNSAGRSHSAASPRGGPTDALGHGARQSRRDSSAEFADRIWSSCPNRWGPLTFWLGGPTYPPRSGGHVRRAWF